MGDNTYKRFSSGRMGQLLFVLMLIQSRVNAWELFSVLISILSSPAGYVLAASQPRLVVSASPSPPCQEAGVEVACQALRSGDRPGQMYDLSENTVTIACVALCQTSLGKFKTQTNKREVKLWSSFCHVEETHGCIGGFPRAHLWLMHSVFEGEVASPGLHHFTLPFLTSPW